MLARRNSWVAAALACAACGGAVHQAASTAQRSTSSGSIALPTQARSGGASIFAHACASCHSLVGNDSAHKQGGDLLGYHMTRSQLLTFTREMPTRPLTAGQLSAVVDYVLRAQQRDH